MIKNTLLILTIFCSVIWVSSCNVEDTVADLTTTCTNVDTGCTDGAEYESCVSSDGISYTFDGTTYECDGVDCDEAYENLLEAIQEYCGEEE